MDDKNSDWKEFNLSSHAQVNRVYQKNAISLSLTVNKAAYFVIHKILLVFSLHIFYSLILCLSMFLGEYFYNNLR